MSLGILGLIVGFVSGGIGVGGGAIMVPTLISAFKFDFRRAAGTSLATIIPISMVGALGHIVLSKQQLPLAYFVSFVPACILGAVSGGFFLRKFNTRYLKLAFAVFIMVSGIRMLEIYDFPFLVFDSLREIILRAHFASIIMFGILTGFISTMLGVGCGLIIVPFFVILIGLDMHASITLSLSTMFFLTMTATIVHNKCRTLDRESVKKTIPWALAGAVIGVMISSSLPALTLKKVFGAFLLIMSAKFFVEEAKLILRSKKEGYGYKQLQQNL